MNLQNDVARCDGEGILYWHKECDDCARRTAPRPEYVRMMAPPEFIDRVYPMRIEK